MKKIIFLDFDGVLNTEHYQGLLHYQGKPWQDEYGAFFDPNNNTIQKMIDAFETMKYAKGLSDDEERTVSEGLSLFCKYFCNLWD